MWWFYQHLEDLNKRKIPNVFQHFANTFVFLIWTNIYILVLTDWDEQTLSTCRSTLRGVCCSELAAHFSPLWLFVNKLSRGLLEASRSQLAILSGIPLQTDTIVSSAIGYNVPNRCGRRKSVWNENPIFKIIMFR